MTTSAVCTNRNRVIGAAFTLVELLTVIAIISLLIGILMPSLQRARDQAKNTRTQAQIRALEGGVEMFRGENETHKEFRRYQGYPPSMATDDPTVDGSQHLFGAHWLVRYLTGKDGEGYIPRRFVPPSLLNAGALDEQQDWYTHGSGDERPLDRIGPYVAVDNMPSAKTKELPGQQGATVPTDEVKEDTLQAPVFIDTFGYPILYYVGDPIAAGRPRAQMARFTDGETDGDVAIFTYHDNALFSGQKRDGNNTYDPWNFGTGYCPLAEFGPNLATSTSPALELREDTDSFQYYILAKNVFEATGGFTSPVPTEPPPTLVPYRSDSFLLITAGKDGLYGTADDVNNFDRG